MADFILILGCFTFAFILFACYLAMILLPVHIKNKIKLYLRSNQTFMRWLYGDEYEEQMPVKVYSEGWREGDYK